VARDVGIFYERQRYALESSRCGDEAKATRVDARRWPGADWYYVQWEFDNECDARVIVTRAEVVPLDSAGRAVSRAATDHRLEIPPRATGQGRGQEIHTRTPVARFDVILQLGYDR
jgi:hypothetical protein